MKSKYCIIFLVVVGMIVSCGNKPANSGKEKMVLIKTEYGTMKVKLYNETPLHRDNFIKLAQEGYYNDLLFHRVIKDFMVQGGDPDSKNADATKRLGGGGPNYQIPAEIVEGLYHKKGALAAARQGDNTNPERKSSGSQFYIVKGKTYTPEQLTQFEQQQKFNAVRAEAMRMFKQRQTEVVRLQNEGKIDSINQIQIEIQEKAEKSVDISKYQFNEKRREIYTTVGGTPHLDGAYTVFGEVVEGFDVIDSIANIQTAPGDRPLIDIKMTVEVIE